MGSTEQIFLARLYHATLRSYDHQREEVENQEDEMVGREARVRGEDEQLFNLLLCASPCDRNCDP